MPSNLPCTARAPPTPLWRVRPSHFPPEPAPHQTADLKVGFVGPPNLIAVDRVIVGNEKHAGSLGSFDDRLGCGRADGICQDHIITSVDEVIKCPALRSN